MAKFCYCNSKTVRLLYTYRAVTHIAIFTEASIVHTNPDISETSYVFLHESAFRPQETSKFDHLSVAYSKRDVIDESASGSTFFYRPVNGSIKYWY